MRQKLYRVVFIAILTFLTALFLPVTGAAANNWQYLGGVDLIGEGNCVIQTSDGGFAVGGAVQPDAGRGRTLFLLAKFNCNGSLLWNHSYGDTSDSSTRIYSIIQTFDGGYAFTGIGGIFNFVKTDAQGNVEWSKDLTKPNARVFFGQAVLQTSDGGYLIGGCTDGASSDWIIKTDSTGNVQWNRTYGVSNASVVKNGVGYYLASRSLSIIDSDDNEYIISDVSGTVKIDGFGNVLWTKSVGGPAIETADGGFLFLNAEGSLTKVESEGDIEWSRAYNRVGGKGGITFSQATEAVDGGYVVCGLADRHENKMLVGTMVLYYYSHVTKINAYGEIEWTTLYEATGPPMPSMGNYPNSIKSTSDGGYVFTGHRGGHVWLVKLSDKTAHIQTSEPSTSPSTSPQQPLDSASVVETEEPNFDNTLTIVAAVIIAIFAAILLLYLKTKQPVVATSTRLDQSFGA